MPEDPSSVVCITGPSLALTALRISQTPFFHQARYSPNGLIALYGHVLTGTKQLPPSTIVSIRLAIARTGSASGNALFSMWRFVNPGVGAGGGGPGLDPADYANPAVDPPLFTATFPLANLPLMNAADNYTVLSDAGVITMPITEALVDISAVIVAPTPADPYSNWVLWAIYLDNGFVDTPNIVFTTRSPSAAATADSLDYGPFFNWPGATSWWDLPVSYNDQFQPALSPFGTVRAPEWEICLIPNEFVPPVPGSGSTTLAWGFNGFGQLGVGDLVDRYVPTLLATDVTFEQVVGCRSASWGRTLDGSVYAWGHDGSGQLGNGLNAPISNPVPILLDTVSGVARLAAGGDTEDNGRCFALTWTGDLHGWGDNTLGALGDGTTVQQMLPVLVNTDVVRVSSGGAHTVIIKTDGSVLATGRGTSGQLGNGFASSTGWVTVTPSVGALVVDVACGVNTTWLLMADGTVLGAGQSNFAQVGFPLGNFGTWTMIPLGNVASIGTSGNTLYLIRTNGEVWTQGSNFSGELGAGTAVAFSPVRQMVVPTGVTFIQIPNSHPAFGPSAIALGSDALAYTWGDGTVGQRGDGVPVPSTNTPTVVPALVGVRWVGGGASSLFADTGGAPVVTARGRSYAQIIG